VRWVPRNQTGPTSSDLENVLGLYNLLGSNNFKPVLNIILSEYEFDAGQYARHPLLLTVKWIFLGRKSPGFGAPHHG
jgi:hypothetical protein